MTIFLNGQFLENNLHHCYKTTKSMIYHELPPLNSQVHHIPLERLYSNVNCPKDFIMSKLNLIFTFNQCQNIFNESHILCKCFVPRSFMNFVLLTVSKKMEKAKDGQRKQ